LQEARDKVPSAFLRKQEEGKVKIPESIKGEKEVQESLNLAYDSVKIENEKEEVLECQFVTTS
ncbi:TPA: hypothetical protein DEW49_01715, partial [bacterium]|nr:hypothetical protein [bacterium]